MRTIKSFTTVGSLLNDLVPFEDDELERNTNNIVSAMDRLSELYENTSDANKINFSDRFIRYAYVYKFMATHANFILRILNSKQNLFVNLLQKKSPVVVAVLGGGPGSEALGLAMFADEHECKAKIRFAMCGIHDTWTTTWESLKQIIQPKCDFNLKHVQCDLNNKFTSEASGLFKEADIFFVVKVFSEMQSQDALRNIIEAAQSGSVFVFMDNRIQDLYAKYDEILSGLSCSHKFQEEFEKYFMVNGEQVAELGPHNRDKFHKLSFNPSLAIRISVKS